MCFSQFSVTVLGIVTKWFCVQIIIIVFITTFRTELSSLFASLGVTAKRFLLQVNKLIIFMCIQLSVVQNVLVITML